MEEAGALLSVQIFPYKLTQGALEARLVAGETVLPGQLLRFDELPSTFGEVSEVQSLPDSVAGLPEGHNVKIMLLRGTPSLKPTYVTPLTEQEMVAEVVRLLPAPEYPVDFGTFRSDYLRLGPFTVVEGPNFLLKYQALLAMMEAVRPYQKILILDPVGVFESVGDIACFQAGETVRLSLQQVSIRRFLEAFGSLFPEGVRKPVTEAVASHWPESGTFSGFSPMLVSGMITESLLKNIILQNCAHVIRNKLFAELPSQVLDLKTLAQNRISVLDLSLLQEPWKSFFYQEVMAQVFTSPELGLTPVLIYPENYLPDLPDWIQRADETDRHMLAVASNYGPGAARQWASNLVSVRVSQLPTIRGDLTLGLPVAFGEPKDWLEPPPAFSSLTASPATESLDAPFAELPSMALEPVASELSAALPTAAVQNLQEDDQAPSPSEELSVSSFENVVEVTAEDASLAILPEPVGLFETLSEPSTDESSERAVFSEASNTGAEGGQFNSWQQETLFESDLPVAEDSQSPPAEAVSMPDTAVAPPLSLSSASVPVPSFFSDEMSVIDLGDTVLEEAPGFLSLEQLRELLNTPSPSPSEPSIPASSIQQFRESLNYPNAEEGAIPDEMGDSSNFPRPELSADGAAPRMEAVRADSSPGIPVPPVPSFPEPEAYAPDEFEFDVNLDQKVESLFESRPPAQALPVEPRLGSRIAQSMDRFEEPVTSSISASSASLSSTPAIQTMARPEVDAPETPTAQALSEPLPAALRANQQTFKADLDVLYPPGVNEANSSGEAFHFETSPSSEGPTESSAAYLETPSLPVAPREAPSVVSQSLGEEPSSSRIFHVGDKVRHEQYGLGIVQKVIPVEQSMILNITFESVGKRLLDPALTQLTLA